MTKTKTNLSSYVELLMISSTVKTDKFSLVKSALEITSYQLNSKLKKKSEKQMCIGYLQVEQIVSVRNGKN